MKKKLLCFLCVLALFASEGGIAAPAFDMESESSNSEITAAESVMQKIYDAVLAGDECVVFSKDEIGNEWPEMETLVSDAMNNLFGSSPEISWKLDSEWSYTIGTDGTVTVGFSYLADVDGLRQMQAEIEAKTEAVLMMVNEENDLFDKLLVLHDYLCTHIEYAGGDHDQGIYGALVEGRCVCAGYAAALAYFLDLMDLQNSVIIGTAVNGTGEDEIHAWNRLTVNGTEYYMDLTWDNTDEYVNGTELVMHNYFMVSADSMREHEPDDPADMPDSGAGEGALNYFVHEGSYLFSYSRKIVKEVIGAQADEGKSIFTFCFSDRESYMQAEKELIENGELSRILSELGCVGNYTWYTSGADDPENYGWAVVLETDNI